MNGYSIVWARLSKAVLEGTISGNLWPIGKCNWLGVVFESANGYWVLHASLVIGAVWLEILVGGVPEDADEVSKVRLEEVYKPLAD